jgi:hypothetical protein
MAAIITQVIIKKIKLIKKIVIGLFFTFLFNLVKTKILRINETSSDNNDVFPHPSGSCANNAIGENILKIKIIVVFINEFERMLILADLKWKGLAIFMFSL